MPSSASAASSLLLDADMNDQRDTPDRSREERGDANMPWSPQTPATDEAGIMPGDDDAPDPQIAPSVDIEQTADPSKD
jgi:hypothetical protein